MKAGISRRVRPVARPVRTAARAGLLLLAAIAAPVRVPAQEHDGGVDVTISRPPPEKPRCLLLIPRIHPRPGMFEGLRRFFEQEAAREDPPMAIQKTAARNKAAARAINDLRDAVARLNDAAAKLEDTQEGADRQGFDQRWFQLLKSIRAVQKILEPQRALGHEPWDDLADLEAQWQEQMISTELEVRRCPLLPPDTPRCLLSIPRIHPRHAGMYEEMRKRSTPGTLRKAVNDLQDAVSRLNDAATKLEATKKIADKQGFDRRREDLLNAITALQTLGQGRFRAAEMADLADLVLQMQEQSTRTDQEIGRCPLLP